VNTVYQKIIYEVPYTRPVTQVTPDAPQTLVTLTPSRWVL